MTLDSARCTAFCTLTVHFHRVVKVLWMYTTENSAARVDVRSGDQHIAPQMGAIGFKRRVLGRDCSEGSACQTITCKTTTNTVPLTPEMVAVIQTHAGRVGIATNQFTGECVVGEQKAQLITTEDAHTNTALYLHTKGVLGPGVPKRTGNKITRR